MATIAELRDNRNKLLQDAQKILLDANKTAEQRTSAKKMIADAGDIENDLANLEAIEVESRSVNPPPRASVPGASREDNAERSRKALLNYMRSNNEAELRSVTAMERRDLTTTTAGSFIPQGFYPVLTEAEKSWGNILPYLNNYETENGSQMKVALDDDTQNLVTVIGEDTSVVEVDPTPSFVLSSTDTVTTGQILLTIQSLEDSAFDLDAWVRNAFGRRFFRGVTNLVTNGSSTGNIQALTSITAGVTAVGNKLSTATSIPPGATTIDGSNSIGYQDIVSLWSSLDPDYQANAVWSMHNQTRGYLLGVTNTLGNPLFVPNPSTGAFDTLLNRPVVLNQFLPTIAPSKVTVQFGDFKQGYLYRKVKSDLRIFRLNERFMTQGAVAFIGFARVAGNITDAGTHPIVSLTQSAAAA